VEFCSHIARHFTNTPGKDRIERARLSLAHMGSSVSKITLFCTCLGFYLFWYSDFECSVQRCIILKCRRLSLSSMIMGYLSPISINCALGKKKICGFPFSRPYLAFGRRNPDPKRFYWIMLVSVST
jgi:hypothetical protein